MALNRLTLAAGGLLIFALYLAFASQGLDDFDSYSFVLALENYDIALQQPHPPGFPVYIMLADALQLITGDAQRALMLLSAISGALSAGAMIAIGAALGYAPAGILAAVWVAVLPGVWQHSAIALSDMPGMVFSLWATAGLLLAGRDQRWFMVGCVLAGLSLGVRPQNALPVALAGLVALWRLRGHWRTLSIGLLAGLGAVLLWLLPVLADSGGVNGYLALIDQHREHVVNNDSLLDNPITADALRARWDAFRDGWILLLGGDAGQAAWITAALLVGAALAVQRCFMVGFVLIWFVASAGKLFLLESLERPRLYLPVIFPLVILAAWGWLRLRVQWARLPAAAALILTFYAALPGITALHTTPAAPEQAAAHIRAAYPPGETLIIAQGSFRAAQVELAGYPLLFTGQFDPAAWAERIDRTEPSTIIVLDRDEVSPAVIDALGAYIPVDDRTVERDRRAFPQHVTVRVQAFAPLDGITPAMLALPDSGIIQTATDGKYFGAGWYRAEDIGGVAARWTDATATVRVQLPTVDHMLTLQATPLQDGQTVTVQVNGAAIDTITLNGIWQDYTVPIEAALLTQPLTEITLIHATSTTPAGGNRPLAAAYSQIMLDSAP